MTPSTRTGARGAWTLALAAALCSVGCRLTDASIWNLNQIHNADGSFRRVGAVVSGPEYFVRFGILSFAVKAEDYQDPALEILENPAEASLDNLNILAEDDSGDPGVRRAQVEWFGFLAVDSRWRVARERCVEELGRLAIELEVEPLPGRRPDEAASVDEVREALLQIVLANGEVLRGSRELGPKALREACDVLQGFELTRRGALSALRGVGPLEEAADRDEPGFAPLLELSLDLQRRVVRLSLEEALRDESPWVLASAIRANSRAFGDAVLAPLVIQLTTDDQIFDDQIVVATLGAIEDHGLPGLPENPDGEPYSEAQQLEFRLRCVNYLVETGTRHPTSAVRYAALRTLRAVEEPEFGPREEEWQAWWSTERAKRVAELERAIAETPSPPTATPDPGPSPGATEPGP